VQAHGRLQEYAARSRVDDAIIELLKHEKFDQNRKLVQVVQAG
jgi:hypothetical protein